MLDILAKFDLKIQMVNDECGELNKLELNNKRSCDSNFYSKTVDFDFKNLMDLTSEDILKLFDLTILIEIENYERHPQCVKDDIDYKKRSQFTLKDGNKYVSTYYHQVITIPQNSRIINNTPSEDGYSIITLTYL
jgi:hypothetical protein